VPSPSPRHIITKLVVICRVLPRRNTNTVSRARAPTQNDRGDAVVDVRPAEVAVEGEIGWRANQPQRSQFDAISVVIERGFVDQGWIDGIDSVQHRGIGRIPEGRTDGRHVICTEYGSAIVLRNLFGHEVPKDREFVADVLIDADNFFPYVRG
jgi:hypothetical protein